MKKLAFLFIFITQIAIGQNSDTTLNLEYCQIQAISNYPLIKQKELLKSSTEYKIKNLNVNYLPQLNLNGQATYQSDVTKIPINIPGIKIPEINKDSYKLTLDVNQIVYDGGLTRYQKNIEKTGLLLDEQNLEIELYKVKDRVNQLYFSIILFQKNEELLRVMQTEINSKLAKMEAAIKGGIALENNADILKAELIKIDQQLIEIIAGKTANLQMLGELINKPIGEKTKFILPEPIVNISDTLNNRLEFKAFDLQKDKIYQTKNLSISKLLPRVSVFGQAGYGRPGLNMFSNTFDTYYMVGAKLSWNLWNWNQSKNEKRVLDIQSSIVDSQKELFDMNLKMTTYKDNADIQKFMALIEKDNEIIILKTKIAKNASYQLDNGIITATEYTTELNSELQAKLNMELHKIQLILSKINYLNNLGKL
jgi:outer membrane protein TolC